MAFFTFQQPPGHTATRVARASKEMAESSATWEMPAFAPDRARTAATTRVESANRLANRKEEKATYPVPSKPHGKKCTYQESMAATVIKTESTESVRATISTASPDVRRGRTRIIAVSGRSPAQSRGRL